ncbi:MAG TPA: hypothetical protein PLX89_18070 [Verrucomicrobiota bacterium]|nr:hypothetical protein [Verrucomicrobiota bacterium]
MDNLPSPDFDVARLVALKRHEVPPPGFADYLRGRIMRQIAEERERAARPWWSRLWDEVTWQRGMVAANALALTGVAVIAVATFQVAHSVANEEIEGQVYAALPLPPEVLDRAAEKATKMALDQTRPMLRPLPSSGAGAAVLVGFSPDPELVIPTNDAPRGLFDPPSVSNPRFILARDR